MTNSDKLLLEALETMRSDQMPAMTFELVGEPHDGFMFEADP